MDLPIAFRKGTRECTKTPFHKLLKTEVCSTRYPLNKVVNYEKLCSSFKAFTVSLDHHTIPTTVDEAMKSKYWKQAIDEEMNALIKNETWDLVPMTAEHKPVDCKWVFFPQV